MTSGHVPELTLHLRTFAATDPGDWSSTFAQAEAADAVGIDRVLASDHVVFGERLDEYGRPEIGGVAGGKQPTGPDGHWLDPMTLLGMVAARTTRVRLRTQILIAALRRPVTLAKAAATLDVLSDGRFEMGVGVGWQREEYDAAGLAFDGRGRLLDHTLEVCRELWTQSPSSYTSDELAFEGIHQMPKPRQAGGVPVWVSGTVRKVTATRLARFGVGWIPWGTDAADLVEAIPRMRDAVHAAGGDGAVLAVAGDLPAVRGPDRSLDLGATMEGVPALVDAGVTDFSVPVRVPPERPAAEDLLAPIVEAFRAATGRRPPDVA